MINRIKNEEIEFNKYKKRGAYHWNSTSMNLFHRNAFLLGRYKNILSLLKFKFGKKLTNKKILDIGCGDGVLTYWLAKTGANVYGVDSSEHAIELAKEKTKNSKFLLSLRTGSAYDLPFANDEFDIVISSDVIEHVKDTEKFLSEVKRVTKHGGIIVISTPIKYTEEPLDKLHVKEWFPNEFKLIITNIFQQTEFVYTHPLVWTEIYTRNVFFRMIINLISYIKNPFENLRAGYNYKSLQYSISKKVKLEPT